MYNGLPNGIQQPMSQAYNPHQICQICDRKGHSALTCFQHGCQICHRVGHVATTCFDRNEASQGPFAPMSAQVPYGPSGSTPVWNPFVSPQGLFPQSMSQLYSPAMSPSTIPLAMQA